MTSLPFYPFFPGDYAQATADLSLLEHGAYRLLLDAYYSADGPIPRDTAKLARICRATTPEEQQAVEAVVKRFFTADGDVLRNQRADKQVERRRRYIDEQSRKGKLSADKRWGQGITAAITTDTTAAITAEVTEGVTGGQPKSNHPDPDPDPSPDPSPDPKEGQNTGIIRKTNDAPVFPSSDGGNGHGKPASKGRPYIDDLEITNVQRRVLDAWEEKFGKPSGKERLKAAKAITAMTRPLDGEWMEEDLLAVVDWYADKCPPHPMSPGKFFGPGFTETATLAGVK